jgi:hypothetical protein
MNRNEFLNMMTGSVRLNRQNIGEVYELIDIFPYFQSAHMVLLKGLQDSADVKFENQLRNSAIHIADREVLYYHLEKKTEPGSPQPDAIQINTIPAVEVTDTQQTVIETGKNSQDIISEIEKNSGEAKPDEEKNQVSQEQSHSIFIESESENEEPAGVMILVEDEPPATEDKVFFMDPGFSVPDQIELLELDLDEDLTSNNGQVQINAEVTEKEDKKFTRQSQADLIDKFIISNPRIEPAREKSDTPLEDLSKPSSEEGLSFITETLAKIYIAQGYYSKAIDIYEKLSLKFPEKSSYFATQIEKVKEHIKN